MQGWLAVGLLGLLPGVSVHAQQPDTLRSTSTLVIVPTLVRDASGDVVETLNARDFIVRDNGIEQAVSGEIVEQQPVALVVLMQTGGAGTDEFASYAKLGTMLDTATTNRERQLALVTFDSQPEDMWGFSRDARDLDEGFTRPRGGDDKVALFDAVSYGIDLLKDQPPRFRRVLLLLSQKLDVGSKLKAEEVVRRLGENNVTIYSVTFSPEKRWLKDQFTKPRKGNAPYQFSPDLPPLIGTFNLMPPLVAAVNAMRTDAASEIASLSGGEAFAFDGRHGLEQQLGVLANHLPNRYMLSFRPGSGEPGFHRLEVQVRGRPDLQVAARSYYWAVTDGKAKAP